MNAKKTNKPYPYARKEKPQNAEQGALVIKSASFITSAAKTEQFITPDKPMIAVCGKSNVGKSSFINMLAGQKKLAKTSSEPGRTRLVNYFDFGSFILADLPGYGFARVSKGEKERWAKTLDSFFQNKQAIAHVFMLADSRHDPTEDDMQMVEYLHYHTIPFTVTLTKADKLSKMKLKEHIKAIAADMYMGESNLLATSAETGYGKAEVLAKIAEVIATQAEKEAWEKEEREENEQETEQEF